MEYVFELKIFYSLIVEDLYFNQYNTAEFSFCLGNYGEETK